MWLHSNGNKCRMYARCVEEDWLWVSSSRNSNAIYDVLIESLSLKHEKRETGLFDFKTVVLDLIDVYK